MLINVYDILLGEATPMLFKLCNSRVDNMNIICLNASVVWP